MFKNYLPQSYNDFLSLGIDHIDPCSLGAIRLESGRVILRNHRRPDHHLDDLQ